MPDNSYLLRYLPIFYNDLERIVFYISEKLHNPQAAIDLTGRIETAILNRLPVAESFEKYHSRKERKCPYYRIYVGNYTVYYVVIDDDPQQKIMEVRRLLYNRRNCEALV